MTQSPVDPIQLEYEKVLRFGGFVDVVEDVICHIGMSASTKPSLALQWPVPVEVALAQARLGISGWPFAVDRSSSSIAS